VPDVPFELKPGFALACLLAVLILAGCGGDDGGTTTGGTLERSTTTATPSGEKDKAKSESQPHQAAKHPPASKAKSSPRHTKAKPQATKKPSAGEKESSNENSGGGTDEEICASDPSQCRSHHSKPDRSTPDVREAEKTPGSSAGTQQECQSPDCKQAR
jgi:hypothetical protein